MTVQAHEGPSSAPRALRAAAPRALPFPDEVVSIVGRDLVASLHLPQQLQVDLAILSGDKLRVGLTLHARQCAENRSARVFPIWLASDARLGSAH